MSSKPSQERYYTSAGDIFSVLRTLQSDRSSISIQLDDRSEMNSSLVLDVNLRSRSFMLDQLTTDAAHKLMAATTPFSLRASINGIRVHARDLSVRELGEDERGLFYLVRFPDKLLYLQRRDAFRAWVPSTLMVNADCRNNRREHALNGRVQNMSATGFRLLLDGKIEPEMEMLEKFDVQLDLPLVNQDLACRAECIYTQYLHERNQTMCGFRFGAMGRQELIAVNRFVTQLQRESIA